MRPIDRDDLDFQAPATRMTTGFPSPADFAEQSLNLHQFAVRNPEATFFWRAQGMGMEGAGISDGDVLVVDRSIAPRSNNVVVAVVRGEYVVRRWQREPSCIILLAEHPGYPPIVIEAEKDCVCWGVVAYILHNPNRRTV